MHAAAAPAAATLVLALDVGTTSLRAALVDAAGTTVTGSFSRAGCTLITEGSGAAEIDPDALLAAATRCIRRSVAARPAGSEIRAVGLSCFMHSLLGIDSRGTPVTRIITWADGRAAAAAASLRRSLDARATHARTGCVLHASFWPARLRWLHDAEPATTARVAHWRSPAEWLTSRLFGIDQAGASSASGTGLLRTDDLSWDDALARACGVRTDTLPTLLRSATPIQPRARVPAGLAGALLAPPIGDGAASNLGCGATRPGLAAINWGTSAAVRAVQASPGPPPPPGLFRYRIDLERTIVGGAISNAGNLYAWCRTHLRFSPGAAERALADRRGPHGSVRAEPFWAAERAPDWPDRIGGSFSGLTHATDAIDLLHACFDASTLRLAACAHLIPGVVPPFHVGGAGARSVALLRRLADALGAPVVPVLEPEASLAGAAQAALAALGLPPPPPRLGETIEPDAAAAAAFAALRLAGPSSDGQDG